MQGIPFGVQSTLFRVQGRNHLAWLEQDVSILPGPFRAPGEDGGPVRGKKYVCLSIAARSSSGPDPISDKASLLGKIDSRSDPVCDMINM